MCVSRPLTCVITWVAAVCGSVSTSACDLLKGRDGSTLHSSQLGKLRLGEPVHQLQFSTGLPLFHPSGLSIGVSPSVRSSCPGSLLPLPLTHPPPWHPDFIAFGASPCTFQRKPMETPSSFQAPRAANSGPVRVPMVPWGPLASCPSLKPGAPGWTQVPALPFRS